MNRGQYFRNYKKAILTIVNVLVLAIAVAMVSCHFPQLASLPLPFSPLIHD